MYFLYRYIVWHLFYKYVGREYIVKLNNGMKTVVKPYPDHDAGEAQIWNNNVDYHQLEFIKQHVTNDSYIYDLGCNVGNRTLALAHIIKGSCLVDAGTAAVKRTTENMNLNGLTSERFQVHHCALGAQKGVVHFTNLGGASTINMVVNEASSNTYEVEMITGDDLSERTGITPTFIKIDVEGQDLNVMKGAKKLLQKDALKLIMVEATDSAMLKGLVSFFEQHNWKPFLITDTGEKTEDIDAEGRGFNLFGAPVDYYNAHIA